jgi:hypothetical protein
VEKSSRPQRKAAANKLEPIEPEISSKCTSSNTYVKYASSINFKPHNLGAAAELSHRSRLLASLIQLQEEFYNQETKDRNSHRFEAMNKTNAIIKCKNYIFRLEVALKMREQLQIALKKEEEDLKELKRHQAMIKDIINTLQKDFDFSKLKDKYKHTKIMIYLYAQLVFLTALKICCRLSKNWSKSVIALWIKNY